MISQLESADGRCATQAIVLSCSRRPLSCLNTASVVILNPLSTARSEPPQPSAAAAGKRARPSALPAFDAIVGPCLAPGRVFAKHRIAVVVVVLVADRDEVRAVKGEKRDADTAHWKATAYAAREDVAGPASNRPWRDLQVVPRGFGYTVLAAFVVVRGVAEFVQD